MKLSDYYFYKGVYPETTDNWFLITPKLFFDQNNYLLDEEQPELEQALEPYDFECMDGASTFVYNGEDDPVMLLKGLGLVENLNLSSDDENNIDDEEY